jgi:uncharacterized membrane protein YccC
MLNGQDFLMMQDLLATLNLSQSSKTALLRAVAVQIGEPSLERDINMMLRQPRQRIKTLTGELLERTNERLERGRAALDAISDSEWEDLISG